MKMKIPKGDDLFRQYLKFAKHKGRIVMDPGHHLLALISGLGANGQLPSDRTDGWVGSGPCSRTDSQCAVRMSLALAGVDCGFSFDSWPYKLVHKHGSKHSACRDLPDHVAMSRELAKYLRDNMANHQIHHVNSHKSKEKVKSALQGKKGIIFFSKSWQDGSRIGNHVDYWWGWDYMNRTLGISPGGRNPAHKDLFDSSTMDAIWFMPVT